MGPSQRTPKKVTRAIQYTGLGVRSVGPVGDFLDSCKLGKPAAGTAVADMYYTYIHIGK